MADGTAFHMENEIKDDINITNEENQLEIQLDEITEILQRISENKDELSTPFITYIHTLYRATKSELINQIRQFDPKVISTLRDQLFQIFLDHFNDETLKNNGFHVTDTSPLNHLRRRAKPLNDIYNIGLSILEDKITLKLASDIFKQPSQQQSTTTGPTVYQNVIDSNSQELLLKINELISMVNLVNKENKELKSIILNLERKIDNNLPTDKRTKEDQPSYANVVSEPPCPSLTKRNKTTTNLHPSYIAPPPSSSNPLQPTQTTLQSSKTFAPPPPLQKKLAVNSPHTKNRLLFMEINNPIPQLLVNQSPSHCLLVV